MQDAGRIKEPYHVPCFLPVDENSAGADISTNKKTSPDREAGERSTVQPDTIVVTYIL